jgi:hypothetical protein
MAGDWIKIEHATAGKAEVLKMARMIGINRREMVGLLVDFFIWCDVNCVDGVVDGVVDADVDAVMSCAGFSSVMREIGWLKFHALPTRMEMVNWNNHNGETAKKRALKNRRQKKWRENVDVSVDANVDAAPSTKASTREEKRRDITPIVPKGTRMSVVNGAANGAAFAHFWQAYPRKKSKGDAMKAWDKLHPDQSLQDRIFDAIERAKISKDWRKENGQFIPYPASWLNKKRWEDELPAVETERRVSI